jgi:hypothetical protein
MELATTQEVDALIQALTTASSRYDPVSLSGVKSRLEIVALAQDLIAGLTKPSDIGHVYISRVYHAQCPSGSLLTTRQAMELVSLRTLLHLKAFQNIPDADSISLSALAERTGTDNTLLGTCDCPRVTGADLLLERFLRLLVCTKFLHQLENGKYAHTKVSRAFAQIPGPGLLFQLIYDESFLMIDDLHLFLQAKGYTEPTDQRHSPYAWKSNQEGKRIWEIMAQNPERFHAFQAGLAHAVSTIPVTGFYDFGKLYTDDDRCILVDVGGGAGHAIQRILQAHPILSPGKFVLQELKEVLSKAENELDKDVVRMEHDFFTPQHVKGISTASFVPIEIRAHWLAGARAYMLRFVLHDYSDEVCVAILKQLVPAMAADSVVLVGDLCLPDRVTPADLGVATMDVTMFNMAGKERSEAGFRKIFAAAGLEYVKTYRAADGSAAITEARLPSACQSS